MDLTPEIRANRVAVARDILLQLDRADNPLKVESGSYIKSRTGDALLGLGEYPDEGDLQDHVEAIQADCQVCFMGAVLLSKARLLNPVSMNRFFPYVETHVRLIRPGQWEITEAVSDVFDQQTMYMMEAAFEGTPCHAGPCSNPLLINGAALFGKRLTRGKFLTLEEMSRVRARAVAENLIENDGVFTVVEATYTEWENFTEPRH